MSGALVPGSTIMNKATVEIAEVKPAAQKIPAHALVVGDSVFDAFGREHRVTAIKVTRVRGAVEPFLWIQRDDRPRFWEPYVFADETITIIPSFDARRATPETQEV